MPRFASIAASAWAGVINQRIRAGRVLTAEADVLFTHHADIIVSNICSAAKNNEQAGLDLAVRKLSTNGDAGSGLTKPAKHELLATRGQQLENIPHIYRRGICLCRSEQTQEIESIIDLEPHLFFRAVLSRLEAKAA